MIGISNQSHTRLASLVLSMALLAISSLIAHFGFVFVQLAPAGGGPASGSILPVSFLTLKITFCTALAISVAQFLNRSQIEVGDERLIRGIISAQSLIIAVTLAFAFVSAIALQIFKLPSGEFEAAFGVSKTTAKGIFFAAAMLATWPLHSRTYRDFAAASGFTPIIRDERGDNRRFLRLLQQSSRKFVLPAFAVYAAGSIVFHRINEIITVQATIFQGGMAVILAVAVGDAVFRTCQRMYDGD